MADAQVAEYQTRWIPGWFSWSKQSTTMLRAIEKRILSLLQTPYRGWYVDIGPAVGASDKIWTISLNEESPNTPLVLMHGFASGLALWVLNLDSFAANRPVYAFDMLGFGRSSRPTFSADALTAEKQLVKAVEEWRREMKLDKIILLGHSLGGFLATSYAMDYPDRVKHLILADPWGFPEQPEDTQKRIPLWVRAIGYAMQPLNPLWVIRFAGPFGQWVVTKARPDLTRKFAALVDPQDDLIAQYIYQCNAQTPSGESAFHAMMTGFAWAKNPMIQRIDGLRNDVPVTLIYGARSWIKQPYWDVLRQKRIDAYLRILGISGAGHHVYADKVDVFNKYVNAACNVADDNGQREQLADVIIDTERDEANGTVWKPT